MRRHVENHPSLNEHTPILALGNRAIPEGQWVFLDVHQKLSSTDGEAVTQVFFNGVTKGTTTKANIVPAAALGNITRMRWGLDDASAVTNALYVILDQLYVDVAGKGPLN